MDGRREQKLFGEIQTWRYLQIVKTLMGIYIDWIEWSIIDDIKEALVDMTSEPKKL